MGKTLYCKINVTPEMIKKAYKFADEIIRNNNQYRRLLPDNVRGDEDLSQQIEIQRTCIGKLGEMVFVNFLYKNGYLCDYDRMFDIYDGESNVDEFDFVTIDNHTVDVKTGFRSFHTRLIVNNEQLKEPKDFYVAVFLNAKASDENDNLINLESVTEGQIMGYACKKDILKSEEQNFGEGMAHFIPYKELDKIEYLLTKFRKK